MLRVLQVYKTAFPAIKGGVDTVVSSLLREPPPDCRCLLLRTAEWTHSQVTFEVIAGVEVLSLHLPVAPSRAGDWRGWWFLLTRGPRALWRLHTLLRAHAIDLVHLHTLQFYQLYFVLCRWLGGPPFVVTLHRAEVLAYDTRPPWLRACWRRVLRGAAAVNAVSEWLAREARRTLPFIDPIHCVTNGIAEPAQTLPEPSVLRERLALPETYCCMVGVLEHYKGHDIALRAWAMRPSRDALVLIGDGSQRANYQALCAELGIDGEVHFVGQLAHDETLALLRDSRAMIMPSRNEGLGLVILEAGLLGVPIIASNIAPFREMLTHEVSGLLFASEDPAALDAALARLDAEPSLAARLARRFGDEVRSRFSFAATARRYADLYRAALGSRSEAPLS